VAGLAMTAELAHTIPTRPRPPPPGAVRRRRLHPTGDVQRVVWCNEPMFYILIFSLLAVLLVVSGVIAMSRRHKNLEHADRHIATTTDKTRRKRKEQRAQSRHDRRKRH
jgi:hypothetical protein